MALGQKYSFQTSKEVTVKSSSSLLALWKQSGFSHLHPLYTSCLSSASAVYECTHRTPRESLAVSPSALAPCGQLQWLQATGRVCSIVEGEPKACMLSSHHHHHHHLCALLMGSCNITSDSHPASLLLTSAEGFGGNSTGFVSCRQSSGFLCYEESVLWCYLRNNKYS